MTFRIDEPCYVISVVSRIVGLHAQTLRYYERVGLVEPSRSGGNIRLYSPQDVEKLLKIKSFTDKLGVNLAGVEIIMNLLQKIDEMDKELQQMKAKLTDAANNQTKY